MQKYWTPYTRRHVLNEAGLQPMKGVHIQTEIGLWSLMAVLQTKSAKKSNQNYLPKISAQNYGPKLWPTFLAPNSCTLRFSRFCIGFRASHLCLHDLTRNLRLWFCWNDWCSIVWVSRPDFAQESTSHAAFPVRWCSRRWVSLQGRALRSFSGAAGYDFSWWRIWSRSWLWKGVPNLWNHLFFAPSSDSGSAAQASSLISTFCLSSKNRAAKKTMVLF